MAVSPRAASRPADLDTSGALPPCLRTDGGGTEKEKAEKEKGSHVPVIESSSPSPTPTVFDGIYPLRPTPRRSDRGHGSARPDVVGGRTTLERVREVTGQRLWDTLHRARLDQDAAARARAEDAVFRHYLPLARELARRATAHGSGPDGDVDGIVQAAEIGLARAILDWRHRDIDRFDAFARLTIKRELGGPRPPAGRGVEAAAPASPR